MDAAVLNIKKTALTVTAPAVAAKNDTQAGADVFLGMIKQIADNNIGRAEGSKLPFAQTARKENTAKAKPSDKPAKTQRERAASKTSSSERKTAAKPADEAKKVKTDDKTAVETTRTEKKTSVDGQKIPAGEKQAASTNENDDIVFVATETLPLQIAGDNSLFEQTDETVAVDATANEDAVREKIVQSAGVVGSIAVIAQQIIAQISSDEAQTADLTAAVGQTGAFDAEAAEQIVPQNETEAFIPQLSGADTAQAEAAALPETTETAVAAKSDFTVKKAESGITEKRNVAANETDVVSDAEQIVEPLQAEKSGKTARQAHEIAAVLPKNVKAAVHVEQQIEQTPVAAAVKAAQNQNKEIAVDTDAEETVAVNVSDTAAVKTAAVHAEAIAPVTQKQNVSTPEFSENEEIPAFVADASRAADAERIVETAGSKIESVSATSGTQTAGAASTAKAETPLFTIQNASLKAKTDGAAQTNAPTAKAPVPTNELTDQIKVNIVKAVQSGDEKVNISLKPKELGNIQVTLEVGEEGELKATVIASRASTLELLQKDSSGLQKALSDAGFKMNENSLNFSYRGEQQQNAQAFADAQTGSHRHGQSAEQPLPAADFSGEADDTLTEAIVASAWTSGRHSLNIRI